MLTKCLRFSVKQALESSSVIYSSVNSGRSLWVRTEVAVECEAFVHVLSVLSFHYRYSGLVPRGEPSRFAGCSTAHLRGSVVLCTRESDCVTV